MNVSKRFAACVGFVIIIVVIYLSTTFLPKMRLLVPAFDGLLAEFYPFVAEGYPHFLESANKMLVACLLSYLLGTVVAIILGYSSFFFLLLSPILDFLRTLPNSATYPLVFLAGFHFSDGHLIVATGAGTLMFGLLITHAIRNRPVERELYLATLTRNRLTIMVRCTLWEVLPAFIAACKQTASYVFVIIVVCEMLGRNGAGIGVYLIDCKEKFEVEKYWLSLISLGIFGSTVNAMFSYLDSLVHWKGK